MGEIVPLPPRGRRRLREVLDQAPAAAAGLVHEGWPETCPACFDAHKKACLLVTGEKPEAFE